MAYVYEAYNLQTGEEVRLNSVDIKYPLGTVIKIDNVEYMLGECLKEVKGHDISGK